MEETTPRVTEISPGEMETTRPAEASRADMAGVSVTVRPQSAARRRRVEWQGLAGELVQFTGAGPSTVTTITGDPARSARLTRASATSHFRVGYN